MNVFMMFIWYLLIGVAIIIAISIGVTIYFTKHRYDAKILTDLNKSINKGKSIGRVLLDMCIGLLVWPYCVYNYLNKVLPEAIGKAKGE